MVVWQYADCNVCKLSVSHTGVKSKLFGAPVLKDLWQFCICTYFVYELTTFPCTCGTNSP